MTTVTVEEPRRDPIFGQGTIGGELIAVLKGDKKLFWNLYFYSYHLSI